MNLKEDISKFRSDLLIGKYDEAIKQAKTILSSLQLYLHMNLVWSSSK